jgi:hypothetical protein
MASTLRFPHRRPSRGFTTAGFPLPGFGSLSEFHPCITAMQSERPEGLTATRPFRGSFPFSDVNHEERHTSDGSHPPVTLRPQGFSPSRRLAPLMAFRACFIPVPLMGFDPSRLYSSHGAVHSLERRAPRGFFSTQKRKDRPARDSHTTRSSSMGPGVKPGSLSECPLGLSRSGACCPQQRRTLTRPFIPSRAFSTRSRATVPLAPQGILC